MKLKTYILMLFLLVGIAQAIRIYPQTIIMNNLNGSSNSSSAFTNFTAGSGIIISGDIISATAINGSSSGGMDNETIANAMDNITIARTYNLNDNSTLWSMFANTTNIMDNGTILNYITANYLTYYTNNETMMNVINSITTNGTIYYLMDNQTIANALDNTTIARLNQIQNNQSILDFVKGSGSFVNYTSDWVIDYNAKSWNFGWWDLVNINKINFREANYTSATFGNASLKIYDSAYAVNRWNMSFDSLEGYTQAGVRSILLNNNNGASYINSGGLGIGMGNTALAVKLDINDTKANGGGIVVRNYNTGSSYAQVQLLNDGGSSYFLRTSTGHATPDTTWIQDAGGGDIVMYGASEIARFKNAGNVGIGESNPVAKLQVNGGDIVVNDTTPTLTLMNTANGLYSVSLQSNYAGTNFFNMNGYNGLNIIKHENNGYTIGQASASITFIAFSLNSTSNINLLYLNGSTGNIGIGTTTPTRKLQIQGDMNATQIYNGKSPVANSTNIMNNITINGMIGVAILPTNRSIMNNITINGMIGIAILPTNRSIMNNLTIANTIINTSIIRNTTNVKFLDINASTTIRGTGSVVIKLG